jgi:phosphatidate cytidylyltransferase
MLRTRVISAAVLVVIVAIPAYLGGWPFLALIALIAGLGTWEYCKLLRQGGHEPMAPLAIGLSVLFVAQAQWPELLPLSLVLTIAVIGALLISLWHKSAQPVTDWALILAGALYIGWLLSQFVRLRAGAQGLPWLALAALMVWAADVFAYFGGRAFGRHPWWPRHSPKKSWEGYLIGALAATLVGSLLAGPLVGISWLEGFALGLLIGLLAPLGDLAESMLKRQVGAKDSSALIPGHGGVLDRIDSLLIAIPIVYYWSVLVPHLAA